MEATTSGAVAPAAAPSGAEEPCPAWVMELRGQLDTLQQRFGLDLSNGDIAELV